MRDLVFEVNFCQRAEKLRYWWNGCQWRQHCLRHQFASQCFLQRNRFRDGNSCQNFCYPHLFSFS